MPSLKQIYDDAINTVEKEPEKIGAHFWLALTASRMMQESNDDSMDYSYADVGSEYFEYQNDPAFRKAMKVYGETQSMERMKEPGSFWKIYDVFDDDLDREPVEDIQQCSESQRSRISTQTSFSASLKSSGFWSLIQVSRTEEAMSAEIADILLASGLKLISIM